MTLGQVWLPEVDLELANTRRALERVTRDRLSRLLEVPVRALYRPSANARPR